jgi:anti-sigma factor RsiW
MHPNIAALVAFCDGEAAANRSRRIARHLSGCGKCSSELRRIRSEKDELSAGPAMPVMDTRKGLAGVMAAVANWRTGAAACELRARLREQIETYFGSHAILVVDRPGMPAEELLGKAGEILDVFLGPAAAEAVRDDVLGGLGSRREAFL